MYAQAFVTQVGAAFPLFSEQMYARLGNQWASTLVGFLALAIVSPSLIAVIVHLISWTVPADVCALPARRADPQEEPLRSRTLLRQG